MLLRFQMEIYVKLFWLLFLVDKTSVLSASQCGCKKLSPCYKEMLDSLLDKDETACIENASIGISTMLIYFQALKQYCNDVFSVYHDDRTSEGRHLYQVVIHKTDSKRNDEFPPVIFVEAGQDAGSESVEMALYLIEQLLGCEEHDEMIRNVQWVILPCTNPDGLEFTRFDKPHWKRNVRLTEYDTIYGVDVTKNFKAHWDDCEKITNKLSPSYHGEAPSSENETIFIENILSKYKKNIQAYLSLRRDGHGILYPYAYTKNPIKETQVMKVAGDIAAKVNQRGGNVQLFLNDSIFNVNGQAHCGHSVDYVYDQGIPLSYEMRVYHNSDLAILSKFQVLPKGYKSALTSSYMSGIKELYNAVIEAAKKSKN